MKKAEKVRHVRNWLDIKPKMRVTMCPFFDVDGNERAKFCHTECGELFPRIKSVTPEGMLIYEGSCPCNVYTEGYVVNRAKRYVKENEI